MFDRIRKQRHTVKELETLRPDLAPQLAPDDFVMVKDMGGTGKLALKTKGPYKVLKVLKGGSVRLQSTENSKIIQLPASHTYRYHYESKEEEEKEEKDDVDQKPDCEAPKILRRSTRNRKEIDFSEFF